MRIKEQNLGQFYKKVLALALPIMLQNGISNFVNMLDNIMIGQIGTEQMSGVAVVNQMIFVFSLCIFGAVSGAGIFTAQFWGKGDTRGVRDTFRFKVVLCTIMVVATTLIFYFYSAPLMRLFLHEGGEKAGSIENTLMYGKEYLIIMLIGLLPFSIESAYSSTLRETGETVVPMIGAFAAVFVNLIFNYLLIFGKCGFPELGVEGAAIATVISRFVQAAIVIIWTHTHSERNGFIVGAYKSFRLQKGLTGKIIVMAMPLLINETLWAMGTSAQMSAYSLRGLVVVAALNISSTIYNLFAISFTALGDAVAIMVGQLLGRGKMKEAKQTSYRIICFSFMISSIIGTILFATSSLFPLVYNTTEDVRRLATCFMKTVALMMPIQAMLHCAYFTIRSGGKTIITFLFDSFFLWIVAVPVAFMLSKYTSLPIEQVYIFTNLAEVVKFLISLLILRSGLWMNNIVENEEG